MENHESFEDDYKSCTNVDTIHRTTRRHTTQFENMPDLAQWVDQAKEKSHAASVYVSNQTKVLYEKTAANSAFIYEKTAL
jgi:hypothetical protein